MNKQQVTRAMGQIADELYSLRKEIRSLQYQIRKSKTTGTPIDIDTILVRLSTISQRMAVLLELALRWRKLAIDDE